MAKKRPDGKKPVTYKDILDGNLPRPRPGNRYVIVEGEKPVVAELLTPTQARIEAYQKSRNVAVIKLGAFERRMNRLLAMRTELQKLNVLTPEYDALETQVEALEAEVLGDNNPTNPDSEAYYMHTLKSRAAVILDVPEGFDWDQPGLVDHVVIQADRDFLSLVERSELRPTAD